MKQRVMTVGTTVTALATALLFTPAAAHADPVVPQPDNACAASLANAMTRLPDDKTDLVCLDQNGGYQWKIVTSDYPSSSRWLTYGHELTLHGEGMRNPEIRSGEWMATPQDPETQCTATQVAVVRAGVVGLPQIATGAPGQPLSLQLLPNLFSVKMEGNCLWTKVDS